MSRWFRVDDGLVDDPKVQRLSDRLFRAVVNLWCVTSQNGGNFPPVDEIAFKLRLSSTKAGKIIDELREAGLVDDDDQGSRPHNWNGRQFKSDVTDPTNAERQRRYRDRHKSVTDTVTVTPPRADTEQIQSRADAQERVPRKYVFESGVIRLTEKHFSQWKRSFTHVELEAELVGMTAWAEHQPNWFQAVSGLLTKRNQAAKERKEKPSNGQLRLTPSGNPWPEGIT